MNKEEPEIEVVDTLADVLTDINGKEIHYRNDPAFKPAFTPIELTPEHLKEYQKCSQDIVYFSEHHVKIMDPNRGRCLVTLYDYQKDILNTMVKNRFVACNTARQIGKSLMVSIYILWISTFQNDKISAILANKEKTAKKLYLEFLEMYKNLENWLKAGVTGINKTQIDFDNGSRVLCAATSVSSIRGHTISGVLFCDEVAWIPNFSEIYASIYPTISNSKTAKVFLTSTPNGLNSWYWLVKASRDRKNEYILKEVYWYQVPGRDEIWKATEIANTSPEQFSQEHCLEFRGSVNSLLPSEVIRNINPIPPIRTEINGDYKIYEEVKEGHVYVITVDPSTGNGRDASVALVLDCTCYHGDPIIQTAMFRSSIISQASLAYVLAKIGKDYNKSLIIIENNFGSVLGEVLENEVGYDNLYTDDSKQAKLMNQTCGINMTAKSKRVGVERIKEMLTNNLIKLNCEEAVEEFSNFVRRKNSWAASSQELHDDVVMSLVMFAYFSKSDFYKEYAENDAYGEMVKKNLGEVAGEDYLPPVVINVNDSYKDNLNEPGDWIAITPDWFK